MPSGDRQKRPDGRFCAFDVRKFLFEQDARDFFDLAELGRIAIEAQRLINEDFADEHALSADFTVARERFYAAGAKQSRVFQRLGAKPVDMRLVEDAIGELLQLFGLPLLRP